MFPILSVKDLSEFVDLAGRFSIDKLYATVFKEDRRPRFPDPANPQEAQTHHFLTLILTAPANIVEGLPTVLRFWTTQRVADEEQEMKLRCAYMVRMKAVEMALNVEAHRGYLTFLGDPSIIPGDLGGVDPSLLQAAEEAIKAQYGAMSGSEVSRDQTEAEEGTQGDSSPVGGDSEPAEAPEPASESDEALNPPPEDPESDAASLEEPDVTAGDPEDPEPPEKGDDYEEAEAEQGDLKAPAEPPSEEPVVKTLEEIEKEMPSLEEKFKGKQ